jgi:hypothetical protein
LPRISKLRQAFDGYSVGVTTPAGMDGLSHLVLLEIRGLAILLASITASLAAGRCDGEGAKTLQVLRGRDRGAWQS